jgi:hypothetical protein
LEAGIFAINDFVVTIHQWIGRLELAISIPVRLESKIATRQGDVNRAFERYVMQTSERGKTPQKQEVASKSLVKVGTTGIDR